MVDLWYRPDGSGPISYEQWTAEGNQVGGASNRVASTEIGDVWVSTVFLGLNHRFLADGPPLLYETMVFGGPFDSECERYSTEAAARAGHDVWVARVRKSEN